MPAALPDAPLRRAMRLLPLLLLFAAGTALAQPGERLPDLTPTSFEITGDVEINLPQLERQPLSGFGPPPRTYVVPAERRSVTRPYGPAFAGLPGLRLPPPPAPEALLVAGRTLRVEGGIGLELARYARVDAAGGGRGGAYFLRAEYDGINPATDPAALPGEDPVRYERVGGRAGYATGGAVRVGIEAGGVWDRYSLPATAPELERTVTAFDAGVHLASDASTAVPAALRLRFARNDATYDMTPGTPALITDPETRFEATGRAEFARRLIRLEGGVGTSRFIESSGEMDLLDYDGGLVLQAHRPGGARFELGARVLGFTTSLANTYLLTADPPGPTVAPVVRVELPLGSTATVFAYTDPQLDRRDLLGVLDANSFAFPDYIAPDVHAVDARAGLTIRSGALGLTVYAGGQRSPARLFFLQDVNSQLYAPAYEPAQTVQAGADLTVATASGIELSGGFAVRDGELTDTNEVLPFYAPYTGRAALAVPFYGGRGRFGLSLFAESARPLDRTGLVDAAAWATLRAEVSYEVGGGLGLVVRGDRLAGRSEQWPGFPHAPTIVMGGLRLIR